MRTSVSRGIWLVEVLLPLVTSQRAELWWARTGRKEDLNKRGGECRVVLLWTCPMDFADWLRKISLLLHSRCYLYRATCAALTFNRDHLMGQCNWILDLGSWRRQRKYSRINYTWLFWHYGMGCGVGDSPPRHRHHPSSEEFKDFPTNLHYHQLSQHSCFPPMPFQKEPKPLPTKLTAAFHWQWEMDWLFFHGQRTGQPMTVTQAKSPLKVSLLSDGQTSRVKEKEGTEVCRSAIWQYMTWLTVVIIKTRRRRRGGG